MGTFGNLQNSQVTDRQAMTCTTTTPTRIDLAGGTLDVWPLAPILQEKCELWNEPLQTLNVAINLKATAQVILRPAREFQFTFTDQMSNITETGTTLDNASAARFSLHRAVARYYLREALKQGLGHLEISSNAQAPKGSGLGGSSSLVVAMLACFEHLLHQKSSDRARICQMAQNLEAGVLGNLAGNQDHYGAAFGGVQAVQHSATGTTSKQLRCDGNALLSRLVLAHSGQQHFSAFNNWLILEKVLTGHQEILEKCAAIARIAHSLVNPLEQGNWAQVAQLMTDEWKIRRTLAPGITTDVLNTLYNTGIEAGAAGGKVCGAGGGGVLVLMLRSPEDRTAVSQAISQAGGILLPTTFNSTGIEIVAQ